MKRYIAAIFALVIGVVVLVPMGSAEAQTVYGGFCCDGYGVRRCAINPSPIGTACYCNYQGWGTTCL